eukprot:TRINITY_DN6122_c0_g1_i1.p1 TRINITY_DN6122_c0_g1~~TRINITY_DN6122_c0_g1_i1.p1  ORF type:complete len:392 (-),score=85.98 TRINITY_DN6122_c0_g1_i1:38-1213(-)
MRLAKRGAAFVKQGKRVRCFATKSVDKDATYLVTGGQGFVGGYVIKRLQQEGVKNIVMMDLKQDVSKNAVIDQILSHREGVTSIYGDISNTAFVEDVVKTHQPDYIIHLAGLQIPTCRVNPILGAQVNVIGTLNVFESVLRHSKNKTKCISYASSVGIMGPVEDYPPNHSLLDDEKHFPRTHYGVFKTANSGNAKVYWLDHGIKSVGLRPATVFGVGREIGLTSSPQKAIKYLFMNRRGMLGDLQKETNYKPNFEIMFKGSTCFNYVQDIADSFIQTVRAAPEGAPSVNIKGEVVNINDFLKSVESQWNKFANENVKLSDLVSVKGEKELPFAVEYDESGLDQVLGGSGNLGGARSKVVPFTSVEKALPLIFRQYEELQKQGRLKGNDIFS